MPCSSKASPQLRAVCPPKESSGSSVEFDWCCVNAAKQVTKSGYCSVLINFNPETVSTDYDLADRLYFDEISLENVLEIYRKEKADGVIVSMGGQTANNLVLALEKSGVKILGTPATQIDRAEDRHKFSSMLDKLQIRQPHWTEVKSNKAAFQFAKKVSYPVLVRPSYVLSGAAMGVATSDKDLGKFLDKSALVSPDFSNAKTRLFAVCPPIETITPSAFSLR